MTILKKALIKARITANGRENYNPMLHVKFHRWAHDISGENLPTTFGIVEDSKTGQIYKVLPEYVQFVK